MGGASTQITFIPENPAVIEQGYNLSVWLYSRAYEMYTHSYQCYGFDEAYRRYLAELVQVCEPQIGHFSNVIIYLCNYVICVLLYFR